MIFRKLIKFGNSSYVISIPSKWIEKNKLKKGDNLYIDEIKDELLITTEPKKHKKIINKIEIDVTNKNEDRLAREIIAAHLNNYKLILLNGKDLKFKSTIIRNILHKLMALELTEQTTDRIIIEDFFDVEDINIKELIRKMHLITKTMISDTKEFINGKVNDTITYRDEDINRINFVLIKLIKAAFKDPSLLQTLKLTPIQCYTYMRLAYYIEKTGDEIKAIVRLLEKIKLDKNARKELIKIWGDVEDFYSKAMVSYYNHDTDLAFKLSSRKKQINLECEKFLNKTWNKKYVPNLVEKIRNAVRHSHGILREVYN